MGTVTRRLADNARRAGASLFGGRRVASIDTSGGEGNGLTVEGVTLSCGKKVKAKVGVVAACDPWALCDLSSAVAASPADSFWPSSPSSSSLPPSTPEKAASSLRERLDSLYVPATTFKLNLALSALPKFACLGDRGGGKELAGPEHKTTAHLLASRNDDGGSSSSSSSPVDLLHDACVAALKGDATSSIDVSQGKHPPIEFYVHSAVDPTVREEEEEEEDEEEVEEKDGRKKKKRKRLGACHSAALFVQLAPHAPGVSFLNKDHEMTEGGGSSRKDPSSSRNRPPLHETGALPASFGASERAWTPEATELYSQSLLTAAEAWCPELRSLVVDAVPYPPPGIEAKFGITEGHIHHVQNTFAFGQRVPLRVAASNLFFASAGAHPGGSVTGAPGHNAAAALLLSMPEGRKNKREEVLSWPTIKGARGGRKLASSSRWRDFACRL